MYCEADKSPESERMTARVNRRFTSEISKIPGVEKLVMCSHYGSCATDCPVTKFSESYRPRKILRTAQFGLKEDD